MITLCTSIVSTTYGDIMMFWKKMQMSVMYDMCEIAYIHTSPRFYHYVFAYCKPTYRETETSREYYITLKDVIRGMKMISDEEHYTRAILIDLALFMIENKGDYYIHLSKV